MFTSGTNWEISGKPREAAPDPLQRIQKASRTAIEGIEPPVAPVPADEPFPTGDLALKRVDRRVSIKTDP